MMVPCSRRILSVRVRTPVMGSALVDEGARLGKTGNTLGEENGGACRSSGDAPLVLAGPASLPFGQRGQGQEALARGT